MTYLKAIICLSIALLFCTSAGAAGEAQLTHVLAPYSNWLNPVDGSYIEFTVTAGVETESSMAINFLIGLPYTPTTSPSAYLKTSSSSCGLEDEDYSMGSMYLADTTLIRNAQDSLVYYWITSSSEMYTANDFISVKLMMDMNGDEGYNSAIDLALTTSTSQYYMVLAQNSNFLPLYILEAPEDLTVTDITDSSITDDSKLGASFTAELEIETGLDSRRMVIMPSGYSISADAEDYLTIEYTDANLSDSTLGEDEYEVDVTTSYIAIRLVNHTETSYFEPGTYTVTLRMDVPDSPTSCSFTVYTMDKYGPNIIESGTLTSAFTSTKVGWSNSYPKIEFSYGMDASSSDLKSVYGLYTSSGTSMVYNHIKFSVKQSSYDIPSGTQSLEITIGSSSVGATVASGTLEHNLGGSCTASSTLITCTGISLGKSVEGSVAVKIAYSTSATISDFGMAVQKVDGVTVVSGTPTLRDGFDKPMANKSPISPSKWGTSISASVASIPIDSSVTLNSDNIEDELQLDSAYSGLRLNTDDQYLYMYSRIGPYYYFSTSNLVNDGDEPMNMFFELTVPKSITSSMTDASVSNGVFYLAEAEMLASELTKEFYWDEGSSEGWLYIAVERELCDDDLDDTVDVNDERFCVQWYCYEDADGDGSYDSPQPCKPVRGCDEGTAAELWFPEVKNRFMDFANIDDKIGAKYPFYDINSDSSPEWALPTATSGHSLNKECRPVRRCDTFDDSQVSSVKYMTKSSYGDDCARSTKQYCTHPQTPEDGILDSSSDGTNACMTVYPCDYDSDGNGVTEARLDGQFCNPITKTSSRMCDEASSYDSTKYHGDSHNSGSDCVSVPLCDKTDSGANPFDYTSDLTMLAITDDDSCIVVPSDDVCTYWFNSDSDGTPNDYIQEYPGLASTNSDGSISANSCVFMPACNMAADDVSAEAWIQGEHVDGKACTLDIPICNMVRHTMQVNSALFLAFSDGRFWTGADKKLENSVTKKGLNRVVDYGYPLQGLGNNYVTYNCIMLDACDTFEDNTELLRTMGDSEKACYKMVSSRSSTFYYSAQRDKTPSAPSYSQLAVSSNSYKLGNCNAVDDNNNKKYVGIWKQMTDCIETTMDACDVNNDDSIIQRKDYWGAIMSLSTDLLSYCIWQYPCTERTDKLSGDIDTVPYGMNSCLTITNDQLCSSRALTAGARFSTAYDIYVSLDDDGSDCVNTPDCYLNAWISGSKYYTHASAVATSVDDTYLGVSFPTWYQYLTDTDLQFITESCHTQYAGSSVDYLNPGRLSDSDLINVFTNEARRLQSYGTDTNALNIPQTLLFVEDVYSDSLTTYNPINAVFYDDSGSNYNVFKFQLASVDVEYVAAPIGNTEDVQTFTLQTWNLVFFEPLEGTDESKHNIFVFKDVSIEGVNKLNADLNGSADVFIQDLFWAVYFEATTDDIEETITDAPSLCGLENVIVYSMETISSTSGIDIPEYLGEDGIYWTTFGHEANSAGNTFPNIFMLYGTTLGSETDIGVASNLVIFFDGVEPINDSFSTMGIEVNSIEYIDEIGTTSASVEYLTDDDSTETQGIVYNQLMRSKISISLADAGDDSWSIIFPFEGGSGSQNLLTIGLMDSNEQLQYLSGPANNNQFGTGVSSRAFYVNSDTTIAEITTPSDEVENIYAELTTNIPTNVAWLEVPTGELLGATVDSVNLNLISTSSADDSTGGFSGVMLCAPYDYEGEGYTITADVSDIDLATDYPNYYGCWGSIEYEDGICTICNIDGSVASSILSPYVITIENFVLPDDVGQYFPAGTMTVLFDTYGEAIQILELSDAGDLWDVNVFTFVTTDTSFPRGIHSEKLELSFSTEYGISSGSTIILDVDTTEGGANEIEYGKESVSTTEIAYIITTSETKTTFNWGTNTVEITVNTDIPSGTFTVVFYGLYADTDTSLDSTENFVMFTGSVENSMGEVLYENEDDNMLTINYGSGSETVSVSDVHFSVDNSGWNSVLYAYISTTKDIYETDYFRVMIDGFTNDDVLPECNIWTLDQSHSTGITLCEFDSLSEIDITPSVEQNDKLSNYGFWISLKNIAVPSSTSGMTITASVMYNTDVTALTSEEEDFPNSNNGAMDLTESEVSISHDYIGVPSTITLTFTSSIDASSSDSLLIAFSSNYGYTLGEDGVFVYVNDEMASANQDGHNYISIQNIPAISAGDVVTVMIVGVKSPMVSDSRSFYVGIYKADLNSDEVGDDNTLTAMDVISTTSEPTDLSAVDMMYPRFKMLEEDETRTESYIEFDFEAGSSYSTGVSFEFRLADVEAALQRAGSVSCSLKASDGTERAENCEMMANVVSFTLKSDLTSGVTYTVKLNNLPNPDWETCMPDYIQIEVWEDEDLLAMSAPALDDSMTMMIEEPEYSLEVDGIDDRLSMAMYPIGFYMEVDLMPNSGVFMDDMEFDLSGDSGFVSLEKIPHYGYNGMGQEGYEYGSITLGVDESAYESHGYLLIDSTNDDIARAPVVYYELYMMTSSLTVNSGESIVVQTGKTSLPITVCADDVPMSEQTFTVTITADDEENDPELSTSETITISKTEVCTYLTINAQSASAVAELTSTMTITPENSLFNSYSGTIEVIAASSADLEVTTEMGDVSEYSASITITPTNRALVVMYTAPVAHYLYADNLSMDDAMDFIMENRYLSPESSVMHSTYTETALEFSMDGLLRNTEYQYGIIAIGADNVEYSMNGTFTTAAGDMSTNAVQYSITVEGILSDDAIMEMVCDLPQLYGIPLADISTLDGDNCYTPIDYTDEMFDLRGEDMTDTSDSSSSDSSSSSSSSSDGARLLQESSSSSSDSSSSSSSSSDEGEYTVIDYLILPPIRSWVPDYVTDPNDADTTYDLIVEYMGEDYEITDVEGPFEVEIVDVASISYSTTSVSTTTFTVNSFSALDADSNQVSGSVCYAAFLGTVEATISDISSGSTDTDEALEYGCAYVDAETTYTYDYSLATADTDYTVAYYGKSIDSREFGQTTDVVTVNLRTSAEVADDEEEEYGFISSVGFMALLLALFFNF